MVGGGWWVMGGWVHMCTCMYVYVYMYMYMLIADYPGFSWRARVWGVGGGVCGVWCVFDLGACVYVCA